MATKAQQLAMTKIVAENTGWTGADLATAVAIMLRESQGNPNAKNLSEKTKDRSYGLFQLNTRGSLWSIYQQMGYTDPSQLLDPVENAKAAYALYQRSGNTFRPWLGYRPGLTVAPQQAAAQQLVQQATGGITTGLGKGVPLAKGQTMAATGTGGLAGYGNGLLPDSALMTVPGGRLETNAGQAYMRMVADAAAAGVHIGITDSYRTLDQQKQLVATKGQYSSTHRSGGAKPGTSEHGWGQAIDVNTDAAGYAWLQANATNYGFEADAPGEKWHFGYVGAGSIVHGEGGRQGSPSAAAGHSDVHGTGIGSDGVGGYLAGMSGDNGKNLGWMAAFLDIPVVGDILRNAAAVNSSPGELQAALMNTEWWQSHQASVREFDGYMATDPATINATITSKMAELQAQAASLGYSIDPAHMRDLATTILRLGMNDQEIANALGAESQREGTLGTSGTHQTVRQTVSDMGVPMSDQTIADWTSHIATGQSTQEDLRQQLVGMAKGLFPGFADGIDRGLTVRQLADPYIQTAAQNLGIDPDTISLSDPKWSGAITGTDPKTGGRRILGLDEFTTKIRSDPQFGWQKTSAAIGQAFGFIDSLGKAFGRVAQ